MPIRLLICCRYLLFAEGLKRLLEDDSDFEIVGMAFNSDDLYRNLNFRPDIILADLASYNSLLTNLEPDDSLKIILLSDDTKTPFINGGLQKLIAKGLAGVFPKTDDPTLLKKAIEKVHSGELWIDRKTISDSLTHSGGEKAPLNLTKKEKEVLDCLCAGYTNKETAEKLHISELTVKSHCNHLFKKFGVSNRLKLALYASKLESTGM